MAGVQQGSRRRLSQPARNKNALSRKLAEHATVRIAPPRRFMPRVRRPRRPMPPATPAILRRFFSARAMLQHVAVKRWRRGGGERRHSARSLRLRRYPLRVRRRMAKCRITYASTRHQIFAIT